MLVVRISLLGLALVAFSSRANAELPSVRLMTAPLVAPDASAAGAWTVYGAATTHTAGAGAWTATTRPAEIKEIARALNHDGAVTGNAYANAVYDYVRLSIATEFRFGLSKGARGAIIDQSGTAFDQAHLMAELLREGGVAASYQLGTITLTGAQFQVWTNLTNAKAACQFLADGGIPASVNGASSCAGLTGTLATVTIGHVWVAANGLVYDPAYKAHVFKAGLDLAVPLGCGTAAAPTCASTIKALIPATTTVSGTTNVQQIQNVPEATINAQLTSYGTNLENWIIAQSGAIGRPLEVEDVVGGKEIDRTAAVAVVSALPYPSSLRTTWTGEIPDQYRSTLRVRVDSIDKTLYADEIAGKRLRLIAMAKPPGYAPYTRTMALYLEYDPLAASTKANATLTDATLTLDANHPYAANAGTYMDENLVQQTLLGDAAPDQVISGPVYTNSYVPNSMTIVSSWGDSAPSSVTYAGELASLDTTGVYLSNPSDPNHLWVQHGPPYFDGVTLQPSGCVGSSAPTALANDLYCFMSGPAKQSAVWGAQASQLVKIASATGASLAQVHHSLGNILTGPGLGSDILNIATSISINGVNADANARQATYQTVAAGLGRLEGSVVEQGSDNWDGGSAASYLVRSNRKALPFFWVDSTNSSTALAKTVNYASDVTADIQSYIAGGYGLIVPKDGQLGNYAGYGGTLIVPVNGVAAFGTSGDRVAYLSNGSLKGAAGPESTSLASINSVNYSVRKRMSSIDFNNTSLSLTAAPDIKLGDGDFPFGLKYERNYRSDRLLEPDISLVVNPTAFRPDSYEIGGGWVNNNPLSFSRQGDGFSGMGSSGALGAAAMLASTYTMHGLNPAGADFRSRLASIFVTNWWMSLLQDNTMTVSRGGDVSIFTRRLDRLSFVPPRASSENLSQTALPVNLGVSGSGVNVRNIYDFDGVSWSLWGRDGIKYTCGPLPSSPIQNTDVSACGVFNVKKSASNGISANYSYYTTDPCATYHPCIKVSSSLGWSLVYDRSFVFDQNGRQVNFKGNWYTDFGDPEANRTPGSIPTALSVKSIDGGVTTYLYLERPAVNISRNYARLTKLFIPSELYDPLDTTNAYVTIDYDALYRVSDIVDNRASKTTYYGTGIFGSEDEKWSASATPLGEISLGTHDATGKSLTQVNPLGNEIAHVFDESGRVLRDIYPEGNALEYSYDVRSNVTRKCQIAKGRVDWSTVPQASERNPRCDTELGDLVESTSYMEGPAVWACTNYKTCNRPLFTIDALSNRTDYVWSSTHGQLISITGPADVAGVRPVTTNSYTSYTGGDGAVFYLLTSRVEKINAANTVSTTWSYNAAKKYTLKDMVVDSAGIALRTCFNFDATGNLLSKTEPRAGLAVCP